MLLDVKQRRILSNYMYSIMHEVNRGKYSNPYLFVKPINA